MTKRDSGRLGGLQTYLRYGVVHMRKIGRLGGRPTWEETLARSRAKRRARQHPSPARVTKSIPEEGHLRLDPG
jgi:hypothetical protein